MKTVGVQVLYNPSIESLKKNVDIIKKQVELLLIIDNSSQEIDIFDDFKNVEYYFNNKNLGIAEAQNIGIRRALELKADFVVFFDQDSTPPECLVQVLLRDFIALTSMGYKPGMIGPLVINKENGAQYSGLIRNGVHVMEGINEVLDIISSGSLVHSKVFKEVGLMDADLFIDGVDHEFCWRAACHGYKSYQTGHVSLSHKVGEGDIKFGPFTILVCTPFRTYYCYRNFIILLFRSYTPIYWKITSIIKQILRIPIYLVFVNNRLKHLRSSLNGIYDGLKIVIYGA